MQFTIQLNPLFFTSVTYLLNCCNQKTQISTLIIQMVRCSDKAIEKNQQ